jgi:hypothetical protein
VPIPAASKEASSVLANLNPPRTRIVRPHALKPARAFSSIPINKVARVYRFHVADEATAIKVDAILKEALPKMKTLKGFEESVRFVCKAELAYEFAYVFDSLDQFQSV